MDRIAWDAQYRPLLEEMVLDLHPSFGNNPGQADSGSRVHAKPFVYNGVKIWETFDDFVGGGRVILAL